MHRKHPALSPIQNNRRGPGGSGRGFRKALSKSNFEKKISSFHQAHGSVFKILLPMKNPGNAHFLKPNKQESKCWMGWGVSFHYA